MPTSIEKLAQELNDLTDYDPMALECTEAVVSQVPGERRINLYSFDYFAVFRIDFDKVLPYDPAGAPGTTSDVFAGAHLSLDVEHGNELYLDKAAADKFAAGYLKMVRFSLTDAAKAGRISSKILARTKFSPSELMKRAHERTKAVKQSRKQKAEFLASLDPVTRKAIIEMGKEIRARRKAEGKK